MKIKLTVLFGIFTVLVSTITDEAQDLNSPAMIWGKTTNIMVADTFVSGIIGTLNLIPVSVRAGIGVPNSNGAIILSLHDKVIYPAFTGYELVSAGVSNKFIGFFLPKRGEQFVLTMTDSNGVAVPKTKEGSDIGKPDSLKPKTSYHLIFLKRGYDYFSSPMRLGIDDLHLNQLDPTKYFHLEKSGTYKLTFVQRLYVVDTNSYLKAVTLPPVTVDVRVEK